MGMAPIGNSEYFCVKLKKHEKTWSRFHVFVRIACLYFFTFLLSKSHYTFLIHMFLSSFCFAFLLNTANSFSCSHFQFRFKTFILLYPFPFFSLAFDKCLIYASFSFLITPFSFFANLRAFIILSSFKILLLSWNFILAFLSDIRKCCGADILEDLWAWLTTYTSLGTEQLTFIKIQHILPYTVSTVHCRSYNA